MEPRCSLPALRKLGRLIPPGSPTAPELHCHFGDIHYTSACQMLLGPHLNSLTVPSLLPYGHKHGQQPLLAQPQCLCSENPRHLINIGLPPRTRPPTPYSTRLPSFLRQSFLTNSRSFPTSPASLLLSVLPQPCGLEFLHLTDNYGRHLFPTEEVPATASDSPAS